MGRRVFSSRAKRGACTYVCLCVWVHTCLCFKTPPLRDKSRSINLLGFQLPSGNVWELLIRDRDYKNYVIAPFLFCLFSPKVTSDYLNPKDPRA